MVIAARDIQYRFSISKMQQGLRSRQPGGRGEGTEGEGVQARDKGRGRRAIKHNVKFEDCKSLLDGHRIDRLLSQFLQKMGFKGPSKGGSIVLQFDKG